MRINTDEIKYIKDTVLSFDTNAKVFLFGSRTNDQLKGGDIDILVFSKQINMNSKRQIRIKLYDKLGEQKIDIVVAQDTKRPFIRLISEHSVEL